MSQPNLITPATFENPSEGRKRSARRLTWQLSHDPAFRIWEAKVGDGDLVRIVRPEFWFMADRLGCRDRQYVVIFKGQKLAVIETLREAKSLSQRMLQPFIKPEGGIQWDSCVSWGRQAGG